MTQNLFASLVLGSALIAAAFVLRGRYQMQGLDLTGSSMVYRLDRLTGSLDECVVSGGRSVCIHIPDRAVSLPAPLGFK